MHFVTGLVTLASAASLVSAAATGPSPKSLCHTSCGLARTGVDGITDKAKQEACNKCEDKCGNEKLIGHIKDCYGCAGKWPMIQGIYQFVPDKNAPPACWKAESSPDPKLEDDESSNIISHGNNEHKKHQDGEHKVHQDDEHKVHQDGEHKVHQDGEPKKHQYDEPKDDEHKDDEHKEQHMETGEHKDHKEHKDTKDTKDTKEQKVTSEVKNQIVEDKAGNNKTEAQKGEQGQKVPLSSSAAGGFHQPVAMVAGTAAALVLGMM